MSVLQCVYAQREWEKEEKQQQQQHDSSEDEFGFKRKIAHVSVKLIRPIIFKGTQQTVFHLFPSNIMV